MKNWDLQLPHEQHFDRASWFVLALALAILVGSTAVTAYRLTLPTDGWSFTRDATGSGARLIFRGKIASVPPPLEPGDVLLAVQNQPYDNILTRALTLTPMRPTEWTIGGTVYYVVLHDSQIQLVQVHLIQLNAREIIQRIVQSWITDPSLLPALLIAFFVFWRRPRNVAARLFFLLSTCFFASDGISQAITGSNVIGLAELFDPRAYWPAQFFSSQIWAFLIAPIYVELFLAFPVPKRLIVRHHRATLLALYGFMPSMALVAITLSHGQPLAAWGWWDKFMLLDLVLALGIAIVSAGHTLLTVRDRTTRAQIQWVAWGVVITSIGALSGAVLAMQGWLGANVWIDLIAFRLFFLGIPIALAVAILRYRLFDIDIVIHRTLTYGILCALLAGFYLVSVVVLQELFRDLTGAQQYEIVTVISTLLLAAISAPLRARVLKTIDRRFYRHKYNTAQTLAAFSNALRTEVDLERLDDRLISTVEETMEPEHVSIWLRDNSGRASNG